ncbi:MAG: bifunctional YncE family protein/alkaline phosphatase family protein [Fimbriimonadales bacterium]
MISLLAVALLAPGPSFRAPAGFDPARVVPGGTTILPNGRFLTPIGDRLYTGEDLWKVLRSPDGRYLVGIHDSGFTVYDLTTGEKRTIGAKEIAPAGAFSSDSRSLLLSEGDDGELAVFSVPDFTKTASISINTDGLKDGYLNDVAVRGDLACCVDIANQQLLTIDIAARRVVSRIKAGREPYSLALSSDGNKVYVANIGLFDYTLIPHTAKTPRGLAHPAFAFPSPEGRDGVTVDGTRVPGLGDPYVPDAQSIWMYDLSPTGRPKLERQVKAGLLIHAPADGGKSVGGSAPNGLLFDHGRLFVSNANNDTVQVFSPDLKLLRTIALSPSPDVAKLRGVIPSGMAASPDGTRLYVCESGLNSIAVVDPARGTTLGRVPSGWFPDSIATSADGGTIFVATQKGIGRGPRGALNPRPRGDERYGLADMPGMIQRFSTPSRRELAGLTRQVLDNNGLSTMGRPSRWPSAIKYVVFITKENHTFDGIFGGLKSADGQPEYAEFGMQGWIREKGKQERIPIMPNHTHLAEQFAISDNFYMEPQASGDGHRWLVGVYPSLWTTRVFYSGWGFRANNDAKGRLVSFGSNGSQIPEDYLENGSLWEHLDTGGITFRNYGEGFEFPEVDEGAPFSRTGAGEIANYPMPAALYKNTCFEFPIFNINIPDIARFDWFKEDLDRYRAAHNAIPRFINIALCNDHGTGPRPAWGYPYVCSYMADNDLALGRTVEYLSHLPEWKNMAVFVTQDDSGADDDHVDRHRSYVLALGPYAKRGYVSHEHGSIMSILRSIYELLGLGPNNMFDALASPLDDMFTAKPDFTPYLHVESDPRVFKPSETLDPNDPEFKKRRSMPGVRMDDPKFIDWLRNRRAGDK